MSPILTAWDVFSYEDFLYLYQLVFASVSKRPSVVSPAHTCDTTSTSLA